MLPYLIPCACHYGYGHCVLRVLNFFATSVQNPIALCLPLPYSPSVWTFCGVVFNSSLSFSIILNSLSVVRHSFRIHELLEHSRYRERKVRTHEMRTQPLLFLVLLILFAFALGIPHRSTIERGVDAAVPGSPAPDEVLKEDAAEAADAVEATDAAEIELGEQRKDAGPIPPDLFADPVRRAVLEKRTEQVKQAFLHSWKNYKEKSLGQSGDELKPKSGKIDNTR